MAHEKSSEPRRSRWKRNRRKDLKSRHAEQKMGLMYLSAVTVAAPGTRTLLRPNGPITTRLNLQKPMHKMLKVACFSLWIKVGHITIAWDAYKFTHSCRMLTRYSWVQKFASPNYSEVKWNTFYCFTLIFHKKKTNCEILKMNCGWIW